MKEYLALLIIQEIQIIEQGSFKFPLKLATINKTGFQENTFLKGS